LKKDLELNAAANASTTSAGLLAVFKLIVANKGARMGAQGKAPLYEKETRGFVQPGRNATAI
jgi:hypothetical protein